MEIEKPVIKGELSEEEVAKLKAQYPGLRTAYFENDETGEAACVYLKKIGRNEYVAGNKFYSKDELTCAEYLLKNLWVGGFDKEEVIKDIDWLKNCAATILPVLFVKSGYLKKN